VQKWATFCRLLQKRNADLRPQLASITLKARPPARLSSFPAYFSLVEAPMRCPSRFVFLFAASIVVSTPDVSQAEFLPDPTELAAARRELAVAKLEARNYWQIEYPRRRRELNAAITFTDAEVRALKRRLREYWPFTQFSIGQPLFVTYQDLKLCILDAELRLRALRDERNLLVRFHSDEAQLLDMRVAEARARVIELEGGGIIEFEPAR
jgi:hypothetical protein